MRLADLTTEFDRGVGIARVTGEVDASNRNELLAELLEFVHNAAWGLVLDLSELRYLDSAGIDMVLRLAERLRGRQQQLRIVVRPDSFIADVLDAVRMREIAPVDDNVAAAVGELEPQA